MAQPNAPAGKGGNPMILQQMTRDELVAYAVDLERKLLESQKNEARLREADEARRESEETYRLLFSERRDAIVLVDEETLAFVEANHSAEEIWGYTREELLNMKALEVSAEPEKSFSSIKAGAGPKGYDVPLRWHKKKDGTVFPVEISVGPLTWKGRKVVCAIVRDITDRVQAERESRMERQRFEILSEHAPYGLAMIGQDGKFMYVNPRFKELFGYELTEIPNEKQWFSMAFPEPAKRRTAISAWLADIEKVRTGKPRPRTFEIVCKDGLKKTVHFMPVQLDNGDHLMTCEDITERNRAEERIRKSEAKLRASHAQFQAYMDNSPVIAFMRDDQGRYVYVNRLLLNNNNLSSSQVLGKTAYEIFPEEMAGKVTKEDLDVVASNSVVAAIESVVDRTGDQREWYLIRFPVQDADGRTYVGGVGLDLTQRINAQKALEVSEARFRQIYEMMPLMVHSVDRDGVIRNVNRRWLSHMGYDREEVIGRRLDDFMSKNPPTGWNDSWPQLWEKGSVSGIQCQWAKKDRSIIDAVLASIIIEDPVLGRVSLTAVHDITDLKRAEEQIKKSLEEKEVLLREINHRVKNNLQVISSLLRLQARQASDETSRHVLQDTQNRLQTIALIHETLYQSRNLASIDVEPYLKRLVAHLFYLYGVHSSQIETTIAAEGFRLGVDKADPLGLIANELVSNCLKHAFPAGRKGIVEISFTSESDQFHFKVSDNGVGLGENFDPFNAQMLGLELVNTLVKQLHGEMTVKRTAGTEFHIRFPVSTS
jgi:PAS domain S-box-containing protein